MPIKRYLAAIIQELKGGKSTEHTFRSALKDFLEATNPDCTAINEPKRISCGAPDYLVEIAGEVVGYIEAKDVGVDLEKEENSEQLVRYRHALHNLILTNYTEFRLYSNGKLVASANIATITAELKLKPTRQGNDEISDIFDRFFKEKLPEINDCKDLAGRLAKKAKLIRKIIITAMEAGETTLRDQQEGFKTVLLQNLDDNQFSDMYAQTICYGLFAARCYSINESLSRSKAAHLLPKTNPFMRKMFSFIAGAELDERVVWVVDDLVALLNRVDISEIIQGFNGSGKEDPVIHFYESFLEAYDESLRKNRGVYFTPEPVVEYIVSSVDYLLKEEMKIPDGLANSERVEYKIGKKKESSHKVLILDPATGTGTFLKNIISKIRDQFSDNMGIWSPYVAEHLLPRLFGFEVLMAPYAIAHMKLSLQLNSLGYDFNSNERLSVYLTNTLDDCESVNTVMPFSRWLIEEASAAKKVKKEYPVMVIVGNPPYKGVSENMSPQAMESIDPYKIVDGEHFGEKKHWLHDDYVKFIRFGQNKIEETGHGILAFVTNHSFIDNRTFRGMRQSLMQGFDAIYIIDLHGSSDKVPAGITDENVFDIKKGVAISLFIRNYKRNKNGCQIKYHSMYGSRNDKYNFLSSNNVSSTEWISLSPKSPFYFFCPKKLENSGEFQTGLSLKRIFLRKGAGAITARDHIVVGFKEEEIVKRIEFITDEQNNLDSIRDRFWPNKKSTKYEKGDTRGWKLPEVRVKLREENTRDQIIQYAYRPFDTRSVYFNNTMIDWPRPEVSEEMKHENLALCVCEQVICEEWRHVLVTDLVTDDCFVSNKSKERGFLFSLYSFSLDEDEKIIRQHNFTDGFLENLAEILDCKLVDDSPTGNELSPFTTFAYIYAQLFSNVYRRRFRGSLKLEFPRVFFPTDREIFFKMADYGEDLILAHTKPNMNSKIAKFPKQGSNLLKKISENRNGNSVKIFINDKQYFSIINSEILDYEIGCYSPINKWLKDRKGQTLDFSDIKSFLSMASAISTTVDISRNIDALIEKQGGWQSWLNSAIVESDLG